MLHLHFGIMTAIVITLGLVFFPFVFASIMTNFTKWKYYKKVYDDLPNKKFIIWGSSDDTFISTDDDEDERFYKISNSSYQLRHGVYIHRNHVTYFDPYTLYWFWKFDRYFKYNPVCDVEDKRNQRIDELLK